MPSFRCTMWILHTGGGSAHVRCGVSDAFPANYQPSHLPIADLTSLGIAWPPPSWSQPCKVSLRAHANFAGKCTPRFGKDCGKDRYSRRLLPEEGNCDVRATAVPRVCSKIGSAA
ncbi:hypothetical protein C7974DRAFT_158119 [Boeremia exigua]|uniref:uncharacterized protein n=1 Tax=Boeremia exigua TaxID=749465 RepID=UPI001E8D0D71|nr:uncharacterized protein C7974DRAFT_158119 [Boeremia exigua]KAH6638286.1 hypothetical protein C7974DRAFT_158119 [Boeremia exigua]